MFLKFENLLLGDDACPRGFSINVLLQATVALHEIAELVLISILLQSAHQDVVNLLQTEELPLAKILIEEDFPLFWGHVLLRGTLIRNEQDI